MYIMCMKDDHLMTGYDIKCNSLNKPMAYSNYCKM